MSPSQPPPMHVSQWSRSPSPAPQPEPPSAPTPQDPPAGTKPPWEIAAIDPDRLVRACRRSIGWLIVAGAAGAGAGFTFAALTLPTRYQATVKLIKKEISSPFRAGRIGEQYTPPRVKTATILSAVLSYPLLKSVAAKADPPVSVPELRGAVRFEEEKKTDLVTLTVTSSHSPKAAANLANLWAAEVVNFGRSMQSDESRGMRDYLDQQIAATDKAIQDLDRQQLDFQRQEGTVDARQEVEVYIQSVSGRENRFQAAKIELASIDLKINRIREELRNQSPDVEKLRAMEQELQTLLGQYTESNPIVIEHIQKIDSMRIQVESARKSGTFNPSDYTGTEVANLLFIQLVELENQKEALQNEVATAEKELASLRDRLSQLPEKAAALARIEDSRQSLYTQRQLLFARLQEAKLFEDKAPGFLDILNPAVPGEAVRIGRKKTSVIFGAAAGIAAVCLAAFLVVAVEILRPVIATPREAGWLLKQTVLGTLPATPSADAAHALWAHWIGPHSGRIRAVWCPFPPAGESVFWETMGYEATRLVATTLVFDAGETPLACLEGLPFVQPLAAGAQLPRGLIASRMPMESASLERASDVARWLASFADRGIETWVRITGPVREPLATLARQCSETIVLVPLETGTRRQWTQQAELLQRSVRAPRGVVVLA